MAKKATHDKQTPPPVAVKRRLWHAPALLKVSEVVVLVLIVLILALKVSNYMHIQALRPSNWVTTSRQTYERLSYDIGELKYFGRCPGGQLKIDVGQLYLCRAQTAPSLYQKVYDTYPRNPQGNPALYPYLDRWSPTTAQALLQNQYDVPSFQPVTIHGALNWQEDPYQNPNWRLDFYSLRVYKDLLDAAVATHNPVYTNKLIAALNSFDTTGAKQPLAWQTNQTVAWRSLFLADAWWKLRAMNQLPITTSNQMLALIEQQGNYLVSNNHYDTSYGNGTDEAAALYVLGVAFPTLPGASHWLSVGTQRLNTSIASNVDTDGAFIAHAPSSDMAALAQYWDIYQYSRRYNHPINTTFGQTITHMVNYATYALQPNDHTPLIGTAVDSDIRDADEFAQIAAAYPQFKYVLTRGQEGAQPDQRTTQFASTGQTIMRSGWRSSDYTQQTQLTFNYGAFTTDQNQLNELSINLYGAGMPLLTGPGTYSHQPGPLHNYFFGTASQNTVMVDGDNQRQGTGYAGTFTNTKDYASQSAATEVDLGVTHERQVTMIGSRTVVVIDKLHATTDATHSYQQLFHLAPGLSYSHQGLTVIAQGKEPQQRLTIFQVLPNGLSLADSYNDRDPQHLAGLCSETTHQILPCNQVSYTQKGKDALYVTVLHIGKDDPTLHYTFDAKQQVLHVTDAGKQYALPIQETAARPYSATTTKQSLPAPQQTIISDFSDLQQWTAAGGTIAATPDTYAAGSPAAVISAAPGATAVASMNVNLNLQNKNLLFHIKIPNEATVQDADILLYSNGASAQNRLKDSYVLTQSNDGEISGVDTESGWSTISLGKGVERDQQGQWSFSGSGFDWSHITAVAFRVGGSNGSPAQLLVGGLATTPGQSQGKVVIIFDDGSNTIWPAYQAMQARHIPGDIGVIGKYASRQVPGYLNIAQLKTMQGSGWSLINHTADHQDAIAEYFTGTNDPGDYQTDVLSGALFLQQNGLNTDPNWFIYPHGTTNQAVQNVIGKYYNFARTELRSPEVYPFGNPLAVKDFIVEDTTSPQAVEKVIDDAKNYQLTQLLTFHRIRADNATGVGYDYNDFVSILNYLQQSGVPVMSLNQLDVSNGVAIPHMHVIPGYPSQLRGSVQEQHTSWWHRLLQLF